jgi:hypothetical protein
MSFIKQLIHVFNPDGSHAGSAAFMAEVVNGRVFDLDPRPVAANDADALSELIPVSLTAALAAVDARDATIAERDAAIQTLTSERDAALAQVAELQAQLNPPILLPTQEFILRFTGAEFDAIKTLAETDQRAAGFVARTRQPEPINLASPDLPVALAYLVSNGCIAADRVADLSAAPQA